jgi:hypothetical protein
MLEMFHREIERRLIITGPIEDTTNEETVKTV